MSQRRRPNGFRQAKSDDRGSDVPASESLGVDRHDQTARTVTVGPRIKPQMTASPSAPQRYAISPAREDERRSAAPGIMRSNGASCARRLARRKPPANMRPPSGVTMKTPIGSSPNTIPAEIAQAPANDLVANFRTRGDWSGSTPRCSAGPKSCWHTPSPPSSHRFRSRRAVWGSPSPSWWGVSQPLREEKSATRRPPVCCSIASRSGCFRSTSDGSSRCAGRRPAVCGCPAERRYQRQRGSKRLTSRN